MAVRVTIVLSIAGLSFGISQATAATRPHPEIVIENQSSHKITDVSVQTSAGRRGATPNSNAHTDLLVTVINGEKRYGSRLSEHSEGWPEFHGFSPHPHCIYDVTILTEGSGAVHVDQQNLCHGTRIVVTDSNLRFPAPPQAASVDVELGKDASWQLAGKTEHSDDVYLDPDSVTGTFPTRYVTAKANLRTGDIRVMRLRINCDTWTFNTIAGTEYDSDRAAGSTYNLSRDKIRQEPLPIPAGSVGEVIGKRVCS